MKENYYMHHNKGFSLAELLISITILSSILIISLTMFFVYTSNIKRNELLFYENSVLEISYKVFCEDPDNFKNNILNIKDGYWQDDKYYFNDINTIYLEYQIRYDDIVLRIIKGDEVIESWHRYIN